MLYFHPMKPKELVEYLQEKGISRKRFSERLGVTEQAIGFWLKQGWITYERQCHIQSELPRSGLRASWDHVPAVRRPMARAA